MKTKNLPIKISESLYEAIVKRTEKSGVGYAEAIRAALEHWIEGGDLPAEPSQKPMDRQLLVRVEGEFQDRVTGYSARTGVPYGEAARRFLKVWADTGRLPETKPAKGKK